MTEHKTNPILSHPAALSVYFLINLAVFLIVILRTWKGDWTFGVSPGGNLQTLKMVVYTFCFGGIGGTTYSIYGLYKYTVEGKFSSNYFYWYLFRGVLGAVLGMILYFLVQGGLLALAQDATRETFRSKALLVGAAFLAGFSANQFISKLKELSQTLWGVKSHKSADAGQG